MKKIVFAIIVASVYLAGIKAQTACPIYQCSPSTLSNTGNSQTCAVTNITATTKQQYVYLQGCNPSNNTCLYNFESKPIGSTWTCQAPSTPTQTPRLPGWKCFLNIDCVSNNCVDGWCQGQLLNQPCNGDAQCDLDLYCNLNKGSCQNVIFEKEACEVGEAPCQFGTVCTDGLCVKMMSLQNGEPVTGAEGYLACRSLTEYGGKCVAPYNLYGGDLIRNSTGQACYYAFPGSTLSPVFGTTSQCGKGNTGNAYCPEGVGAQQSLLNYLADYYFALSPVCHIMELAVTACDNAIVWGNIVENNQFLLAQLTFQNTTDIFQKPLMYLPLSVNIQENDPCTKELITYQYWNLASAEGLLTILAAAVLTGFGLVL